MIRAQGGVKVKKRLVLSTIFMIAWTSLCHAQVTEKEMQSVEEQEFGIDTGKKVDKKAEDEPLPEKTPEDYQENADADKVRDIEAEEFRVKFIKSSRSKRVLLLDDPAEHRPRPGKILLLKAGTDDICAIRVLKNYTGRFAGKVVLPFKDPSADQEYRALKKVGDKIIAQIKEHEKRGKDLDAAKSDEDLAKEVSPDDNELDRGIPSPKKKGSKTQKVKEKLDDDASGAGAANKKAEPLFDKDGGELESTSIELSEDDEPQGDLSIQEELPIESRYSAVSLQYGELRNVDKENKSATYSGVGLRYAFNLWRMPFFKRKTFQDMFSLELGMFYYQIAGFVTTTDSVTIVPIVGTFRYSLLVSENLMFYPYIGFIKNNVSSADNLSLAYTNTLSKSGAIFGVGGMLRIGPSWAVRADFGTDMFGFGAVLKF